MIARRGGPVAGNECPGLATEADPAPGYRECFYFRVVSVDLELLLSFTFLDRIEEPYPSGGPAAHVLALARTRAGRWQGGVDEVPTRLVRFTPRRIDFTVGASALRFRAGAFALAARLESSPIVAHLRLRPMGLPAVGVSGRMGTAEPVPWVVVPRLEANGEVVLGAARYAIAGAPAYHDHSWGVVPAGEGLAWEWGLVLPPSVALPWTIVFSRTSDRARRTVLSQAILVWHDDTSCRAFRDQEISIEETGLLTDVARLRLPPDPSACEPLAAVDLGLPRELVACAESGQDRLELRLILLEYVEIVVPGVPSERDGTVLREVRAEAEVRGTIQGERFALAAPAIIELNLRGST